jgi:hypothetical protein
MRMEPDPVSEMLYSPIFLEYMMMDKVQNPVIPSVIHHHQNPLESAFRYFYIRLHTTLLPLTIHIYKDIIEGFFNTNVTYKM